MHPPRRNVRAKSGFKKAILGGCQEFTKAEFEELRHLLYKLLGDQATQTTDKASAAEAQIAMEPDNTVWLSGSIVDTPSQSDCDGPVSCPCKGTQCVPKCLSGTQGGALPERVRLRA
ncbi:hypothetical protein LMG28138_03596 [Pararobbsia alpina]|uniref:Uncharacterized protein n=1 Tax=Pararobbsia alpina TaxID=621374 RepID=A0A6S7BAW2_9BURK|nr:hypothetical protein LMG28138_03596 [Pararobbsia alpina]